MKPDVVLSLSFETWDDMVLRDFARPPDRFAQYLLRSDQVGRVLIVNPWRSVAGQARRRTGAGKDASFPKTDEAALVRPLRLRRGDRAALPALGRSYRAYSSVVRRAIRRRGLHSPLLVTFNPLHAAFGDHCGFRSATYVARDDWASYHGTPHLRTAYLSAYERIREQRLAVSAVSAELLRRIDPAGAGVVVPNGVDPEVWTPRYPIPAEFEGLPRPLALYTGTIDERLCLPALRSLAQAFANGSVVLIGPHDVATTGAIKAVAPSVRVLSSMKQSRLAAFVQAADVCVLPHVVSDLTQAMSPLKIYEYLAAGVPVVATDLAPVRDIDASVRLVRDPEHFGASAREAAQVGRSSEQRRLAFIAANTWDARCERILNLARDSGSDNG